MNETAEGGQLTELVNEWLWDLIAFVCERIERTSAAGQPLFVGRYFFPFLHNVTAEILKPLRDNQNESLIIRYYICGSGLLGGSSVSPLWSLDDRLSATSTRKKDVDFGRPWFVFVCGDVIMTELLFDFRPINCEIRTDL